MYPLYWTKPVEGGTHHSLGSSIFTVKPPVAEQLWYGNNPTISESPFIVKYQDEGYQRIAELQDKETQALNDYWIKQPELQEAAFISQLQTAHEEERKDPKKRVIPIWELAKYCLRKKVSETLPFEERKALLLKTEEWNGSIHQNDKHLKADELTEANIQSEIDTIGTCWGIEITKRLQKLELLPIALNSEICKIYIP